MFHAPIATGDGNTPSPIRLRVLSLGAGVQSTTLALMTAHSVVGGAADQRLHDGFRCWQSVRERTLKASPCGEALGGPSHRSGPDRCGPGIHRRCAAEAASNSRIKST